MWNKAHARLLLLWQGKGSGGGVGGAIGFAAISQPFPHGESTLRPPWA